MKANYETDFYAWAMQSAALIRQRKFAELDLDNIAEELESMGKSDKRKLINRLAVLLAHLLKWKFQPHKRGKSWEYTIKEQRIKLLYLLQDSPSLNHELEMKFKFAYDIAKIKAAKETKLEEEAFPKNCPLKFEECLDQNFLPE